MDSITTQEDLALFLKNPENAQRLNDMVQDIRDALMDYQVRSSKRPALAMANIYSDFVATRHLRRGLSTNRESYSPTVTPFVVTCKTGRCGPPSSGKHASHKWGRVPFWEQAGVYEGNKGGCPPATRTVAEG